ncbi:MAG: glycosyltransferase [Chitinophagaceae bacterium]|nr:glycosyltransferase [Chitinophagaceae bacterium]MCW5904900.1 glycosyltransferase [Chitinophagaceae bacterium]
MKIVVLNDQLNPGGAEKVLVYMANLLHKNNMDVSVVLFLGAAKLDAEINKEISIHYLQRTSRFDFKAWKKLKTLTKDADIVHVHSRYNLRFYMLVKLVLGISKPKVVFHEHIPSFKIDSFTTFLYKRVDAYVAVQDAMKKWAVEKSFVKNNKAFYLPNTVYPPKQTIDISSNKGKLIMIANFRPVKNHFFAIELVKSLPNYYTLDLYGMIGDNDYFNKVIDTIKDNNVQNRINIIQGVTDLYAVMKNYSLAIHTSNTETGPLVLIEYLYAGLPFITYHTGDVVEIVKSALPECIIDQFDIEIWKKQIMQIEQQNNYHTISANMKLLANSHFSEKAYFNKLQDIYTKVTE